MPEKIDAGPDSNIEFYHQEAIASGSRISDHFINNHMLTHATTNQSASKLESFYDNRVRSRMREMFNLLAFNSNSADKKNTMINI